ncbi:MAG: hypothetical protein FJ146_13240 [Deltaproteobacteria bacterium]|nr:hypothetical protein [Deltaproteobacteria bacterium]
MQLDETTLKVTIKTVVNEAIDEHPTIQRMGSEIGELKTDVAVLKTDVAELKTDVAELKTDVAELKTDVAELKTDVKDLNSRFEVHASTTNYSINQLHHSFHKMSVTMEEIKASIAKVIEIVSPSKLREEQYDRMELKVETHDHRNGALVVTVRDHVVEHERS